VVDSRKRSTYFDAAIVICKSKRCLARCRRRRDAASNGIVRRFVEAVGESALALSARWLAMDKAERIEFLSVGSQVRHFGLAGVINSKKHFDH
jgi:hypothetical protein